MFRQFLIESYAPMGSAPDIVCAICGRQIQDITEPSVLLTWHRGNAAVYQLSNAVWVHKQCAEGSEEYVTSFRLGVLLGDEGPTE